jgi:predicted metalloprotease
VVLLVAQCAGINVGGLLGGDSGSLGSAFDTSRVSDAQQGEGRYATCETGEDANQSSDCARVAVENSLTEFWEATLGPDFRPEQGLVTFTGGVNTNGCGAADASVGPFYCPADETIYLDTAFFQSVLQGQLDGPAGAFVEPYVLAHEYGHHISHITGFMGQVRTQRGRDNDAIRLELQADCFAGLWTQHAATTPGADGQPLLVELTDEDINQAIEAAKTVGDDYIQRKAGGRVDPESWTHGSSEQRIRWFRVGYEGGTFQDCDTFSATRL